jgi:hypothetical protein
MVRMCLNVELSEGLDAKAACILERRTDSRSFSSGIFFHASKRVWVEANEMDRFFTVTNSNAESLLIGLVQLHLAGYGR